MTPSANDALRLAPPPGRAEATAGPGAGTQADPPAGVDTPSRIGDAASRGNLVGLVLARDFQIVRRLGEGGMGTVYLAEQLSLKRKVAVKLLKAELAQDDVSRRRFETEAKAVAQLSHANIVQVYAVGEQDGLLFMALEFVDGWTLKDYLSRKGPPELPIALSIMRQVAGALARAAEVGIIHRDIKPENILLTRKVEVKVTDFGLSRIINQGHGLNLTQTGTSMGTPLYMSPEQVMGVPLDPRTDLYSFGATCYHLLAGHPPFTGDSAMAVGIKHVQDEPPPLAKIRPDLPADLAPLVHRLLAKRPEDRYQTAREVMRDLKRISDVAFGATGSVPSATLPVGGPSSTKLAASAPRPPVDATEPYIVESLPELTAKPPRRWVPWIIGLSLAAAVLAGAVVGQMLKPQEEPQPSATASIPVPAASASKATDPRLDFPFRRPGGGPLGPLRPNRDRPDPMEADLRRRIRETEKAGLGDSAQIEEGVRRRIELVFHYLLREPSRDLEKAGKFCEELRASKIPNYRLAGELCDAVVLALRREPFESTRLLKDLAVRLEKNDAERSIVNQMLKMPDHNLARLLTVAQLEISRQVPNAIIPQPVRELFLQARLNLPIEERKQDKKLLDLLPKPPEGKP